MYEGSAARRYDAYVGSNAQRVSQTSFEVVEGAGLDAQVRRGVSPELLARLKVILVCAVVLCTVGVARIGVYTATASLLNANSSMRTDIKDARADREELRVERSVLSNSQRIERIALSYGMVLADGSETMVVGEAQAAADAAAAEQPTPEETKAEDSADDSAASVEEDSAAESAQEEAAAAMSQVNQTQGDGSSAGANAVDVDSLA